MTKEASFSWRFSVPDTWILPSSTVISILPMSEFKSRTRSVCGEQKTARQAQPCQPLLPQYSSTMCVNWWVFLQILQLVLQEEVSPDSSIAKRSQTTGKCTHWSPSLSHISPVSLSLATSHWSLSLSSHISLVSLSLATSHWSLSL